MNRSKTPRAPAGLSTESRRLWRQLHELYDLSDAYGLFWLETALRNHDLMLNARRQLEEEGATIRGRDGGQVRHPASLVYRDTGLAMERAFKMLNLDLPEGVK